MRAIIAVPEVTDPRPEPGQGQERDRLEADAVQACTDAADVAGGAQAAVPAEAETETEAEVLQIDASDARGERVDRYLAARLDGVSRTRVQQWIALGAVRCEQRALTASTRLRGDERLWIEPQPREADDAFVPEPIDLDVIHEDEHLIVLDKPAGLVVHPGAGNWRGTLLNGLLFHRPELARLPRAGIVHRLDRDTSGLLMVARTERAFASLSQQLADRSAGRVYLALVAGRCSHAGTVDAPIGRDRAMRVRMAVVAPPHGRIARTRYRPLAWGSLSERDVSLLECHLDTGRTHQIRVHLRHIGHALVGDPLYRGILSDAGERQALHARELQLRHPADGREVRFHSRLPDDFARLLQAAGIGRPDVDPDHFGELS